MSSNNIFRFAYKHRHRRMMNYIVTDTTQESPSYCPETPASCDNKVGTFVFCDTNNLFPWFAHHLLYCPFNLQSLGIIVNSENWRCANLGTSELRTERTSHTRCYCDISLQQIQISSSEIER